MFKVGDKVTVIAHSDNFTRYYSHITEGRVKELYERPDGYDYMGNKISDGFTMYKVYGHNMEYFGLFDASELKHSIKPIRHKLKFMKKLSLIAQRLLDKDLRTLVKAGILNEELAVEDTDFVLSYFVSEYKEELAKAASKLIKEKKKKDCEEEE